MFYDYTYLVFVLPAAILSLVAQIMVKSRFAKYDRITSKRGITGAQAADYLLKVNGISDVNIKKIRGHLTDNYNPSNQVLSLSESTFSSTSIAAIGVAAHETGHAIQHNKKYSPLVLRRTLVPAANIGSRFGPTLAVLGLILGAGNAGEMSSIWYLLTDIGLFLFAAAMLFYIVTLPVEFNASRRALKILRKNRVLDEEELRGVKKVLWAAAMTYVAAALTSIGSFLRLLVISRNRRR